MLKKIVYSIVDGHLGCHGFGVIMNKIVRIIFVHFFCTYVFISFGKYLKVVLMDVIVGIYLTV